LDLSDAHYIQFNIVSKCGNDKEPNELHFSDYSQNYFQSSNTLNSYQNRYSDAYIQPDIESNSNRYFRNHNSRPKRSALPRANYYYGNNQYDERSQQVMPQEDSNLIVQITCDGGMSWTTLKSYDIKQFAEPK